MIRLKIVLYGIFSIIALTILVLFFLLPSISKYNNIKNEVSVKKIIHQAKEENYELYLENKDKMSELTNTFQDLKKEIQPFENLTKLIVKISLSFSEYELYETELLIGKSSEVNIENLNIKVYRTIVSISGVGKYNKLMEFINALHDYDELYQIQNIRISSENVVNKDDVFVSMDISIYTTTNGEIIEINDNSYNENVENPFYYQ